MWLNINYHLSNIQFKVLSKIMNECLNAITLNSNSLKMSARFYFVNVAKY